MVFAAEGQVCSEQKDMIEHQEKDESLQPISAYLKGPEIEAPARKIVLEATQDDLLNGVLCHKNLNHG